MGRCGWQFWLVMIAALMVSACTTTYDPARIRPTYSYNNTPASRPVPKLKPKVAAAQYRARKAARGVVIVAAGDTLFGLSRRFGLSVRELASRNGLNSPYRLSIGQQIRLHQLRSYRVRKGDTGYSIARRYGVSVSDLMRTNSIRPPYRLAVGQMLRLPAKSSAASAQRVRRIAKKSPRKKPSPSTINSASKGFQWPLRGAILSSYGPKPGGVHNDGINIAAKRGAPVKAAASGRVVYAGDELEAYGNLILVRHPTGYITAYAHVDKMLVAEGVAVKQGQIIAHAGQTGGVSPAQLHFEIRKGRQAINPQRYLKIAKAEAARIGSGH